MKRSEAFAVIKTGLESGTGPTREQQEQLLRYFAPAVPKTPRNAFEWVARAAARDVKASKNRPALCYVYSDGLFMYGSDGARAHRAITELPRGLYNPRTGRAEHDDWTYPGVSQLFDRAVTAPLDTAPVPDVVPLSTRVAQVEVCGRTLDATQWHDAAAVLVCTAPAGPLDVLYCRSAWGCALIMPLRAR